jgi:hypothetical protein
VYDCPYGAHKVYALYFVLKMECDTIGLHQTIKFDFIFLLRS